MLSHDFRLSTYTVPDLVDDCIGNGAILRKDGICGLKLQNRVCEYQGPCLNHNSDGPRRYLCTYEKESKNYIIGKE